MLSFNYIKIDIFTIFQVQKQGEPPMKKHIIFLTIFLTIANLSPILAMEADNSETTPLISAVRQNDFDLVQAIVKSGADINEQDLDWSTALLKAIQMCQKSGDFKIVNYLIDNGARSGIKDGKEKIQGELTQEEMPDLEYSDEEFDGALAEGTQFTSEGQSVAPAGNQQSNKNNISLKKIVIALRDRNFKTAYDILCKENIDLEKAIQFLLTNTITGIDIRCKDGLTLLMHAIAIKNFELVKLLLAYGANPNACNNDQITPLMYAISFNCFEIIDYLINKGALINACDRYKKTPLVYAAEKDNFDLIKKLVNLGAIIEDESIETSPLNPVHKINQAIVKFLRSVAQNKNITIKETSNYYFDENSDLSSKLIKAFESNDLDTIQDAILHGIDINLAVHDHETSILILTDTVFTQHTSCRTLNINPKIVQWLLKTGYANINKTDQLFSYTPLITTINLSHFSHIAHIPQLLIAKGADIHKADNNGRTPLIHAIDQGNLSIIQLLIAKGADIHKADNNGRTPLIHAIGKRDLSIIQLLIAKGANIHTPDKNGRTPLMYAMNSTDLSIAQLLIAKGADIHMPDNKGRTPLIHAIDDENPIIAQLLISKGADIHMHDNEGRTPLMCASTNKDLSIAQLLIAKGADIHMHDNEERTPLIYAINKGNLSIAQLLIAKGANIHKANNNGRTPLIHAIDQGDLSITQLLVAKGADIRMPDNKGRAPLMYAIDRERNTIAQLLITKGADIHTADNNGITPLMFAILYWGENTTIAQLLITNGVDIHTPDNHGITPLIYAIDREKNTIAQLLIAKGADINTPDNRGISPLMHAIYWRKKLPVAQLLIEAGANVNVPYKANTSITILQWVTEDIKCIEILKCILSHHPNLDEESKHKIHGWAIKAGNKKALDLLENNNKEALDLLEKKERCIIS